jgi:basic amino acid/polyamine antiporter, APA family
LTWECINIMNRKHKIGWLTATALVIANMIGAGVFTSLGFQLIEVTNTWSIITLWILGAILAFCGALSYAELSTSMVRSGGEYQFLSEMYHPLVGYLSGWVSLTVGFAAPVALASMAFGGYLSVYTNIDKVWLASIAVISITLLHTLSIKHSSILQNSTTIFKLLVILLIIGGGFLLPSVENAYEWGNLWKNEVLLPGFVISFVYVTFSYSGWNAASYITEEIKSPLRNIPKALLTGTLLVSILYILLNLVFLKHGSLQDLQGQLEVGQVAANSMFGNFGGKGISIAIGLILISSISAMIWIGPRITQVMGEDYRLWHWFSKLSQKEIPKRAIFLQMIIALILLLSGTFQQVLIFSGFILQLFGALTVASVFINRNKKNKSTIHFKTPYYPIPQLIFLLLSAWILIYLLYIQPWQSILGLINVMIGIIIFKFDKSLKKEKL